LKAPALGIENGMATEPGLDRHEWESEWASIMDDAEDSLDEALPLLDGLVMRMLEERGFALLDPVAEDGDDPEILASFRAAHDVTMRVDRDNDVEPDDIREAVDDYRAVFDFLVAGRGAP
jgi:hypothetical protein